MIVADDFELIKARIELLKKRQSESEGAMKEILATLKKEFKVNDIHAAKALLKSLQSKENEMMTKYTKAMEAFVKKHKEWIESDE